MRRKRSVHDIPAIVYALVDPRDGKIHYIGITVKSAQRRMEEHMDGAMMHSGHNQRKEAWLRDLWQHYLKPRVRVLQRTKLGDAPKREQYWIRWAWQHGHPLLNGTAGGEHPLLKKHGLIWKVWQWLIR